MLKRILCIRAGYTKNQRNKTKKIPICQHRITLNNNTRNLEWKNQTKICYFLLVAINNVWEGWYASRFHALYFAWRKILKSKYSTISKSFQFPLRIIFSMVHHWWHNAYGAAHKWYYANGGGESSRLAWHSYELGERRFGLCFLKSIGEICSLAERHYNVIIINLYIIVTMYN